MTSTGSGERAVSDVVAFALVFGMVITIVSATFVLGMDGIEALGNDGQMQTADLQMDAVAVALDDIHRHGSVARSVEVELDGGTLELVDSEITIREDGSPITGGPMTTNALELRRDQGVVAYEGGAVVRQNDDGTGGLVRSAPVMYCRETGTPGDYEVFVSTVELEEVSGGSISIGGDDSVKVIGRLKPDEQKVVRSVDTPGAKKEVVVGIDGLANDAAARSHFERAENWHWDSSENGFRCGPAGSQPAVSKIVVRTTTITLETRR